MSKEVQYEIYVIESIDYWYVGSAILPRSSAVKRFERHVSGKGSGTAFLHSKIVELGEEHFSCTVVESRFGDHIAAEREWYDSYLADDPRATLNGRRPGAWDGQHRPETCAKISASNKGRVISADLRLAASLRVKGSTKAPCAEETKEKISQSLQGHPVGQTTKRKQSIIAIQTGRSPSMDIVECECGLITKVGPLARHIKATGHQQIP